MLKPILDYPLHENQYCKGPTAKKRIVLHHTAGGPNAQRVVDVWNTDQWGRVGTHYVIGADGQIFRTMKESDWAYALGLAHPNNTLIEQGSIQIELCAFGWLRPGANGIWYNWTGQQMSPERVYEFSRDRDGFSEWQGCRAFEAYTEPQIEALLWLIADIRTRHPLIPAYTTWERLFRLQPAVWQQDLPGIFGHATFNTGKTDIYPDHRIIQALCR